VSEHSTPRCQPLAWSNRVSAKGDPASSSTPRRSELRKPCRPNGAREGSWASTERSPRWASKRPLPDQVAGRREPARPNEADFAETQSAARGWQHQAELPEALLKGVAPVSRGGRKEEGALERASGVVSQHASATGVPPYWPIRKLLGVK
jgi:hypothetical protein